MVLQNTIARASRSVVSGRLDDSGWLLRVEHRLVGRLRWFRHQYLRFSGVEGGGVAGGGLGTLLGPEGAGRSFCLALQRRCLREGVLVCVWGWPRSHTVSGSCWLGSGCWWLWLGLVLFVA